MEDWTNILKDWDDDNPRYWKYCEFCGKELQRSFGKSRFDKITGKETKHVTVFCADFKHTWDTYESDSLEVQEIPF